MISTLFKNMSVIVQMKMSKLRVVPNGTITMQTITLESSKNIRGKKLVTITSHNVYELTITKISRCWK